MTQAGGKAYDNLTSLIYDLNALLGDDLVDSFNIINELDKIVNTKY